MISPAEFIDMYEKPFDVILEGGKNTQGKLNCFVTFAVVKITTVINGSRNQTNSRHYSLNFKNM